MTSPVGWSDKRFLVAGLALLTAAARARKSYRMARVGASKVISA